MRKPILLLTALLFSCTYLFAQNSMVGDGFGGRGWYVPHNYQVGSYSAFTICGDSNQLYGWGSNKYGELGNGTFTSTSTPVTRIGMTNVKFYTTGYISATIKNDYSSWVWGVGINSSNPVFTTTPQQKLNNVKFVDAGMSHIVFVKNDGSVWAAGGNFNGELGDTNTLFSIVTNPVQMLGINNAVRAVAAGGGHANACTVILLADSTLKITGGGGWFREINTAIPEKILGIGSIVDIKANNLAVFALDVNGDVFSFGRDWAGGGSVLYGSLGLGATTSNITPPTKITFPIGTAPIVALSANNDGLTCLALDSNHNVYGWGRNTYGELGDGTYNNQSSPKLLATNVIDIFSGENFSYILKSDNNLWATGTSGYNSTYGSIWMNLDNMQRNVFTQIDPTIAPMNLCAPKVYGVVPVKLSNFTCVANNNNAYLNWQSAEEINASKYIVEYSSDGRNFQSIATVFANGSNSKYNFIHQQVRGTAFYRLKMIDKDGSFKYSEIRVVKFDKKAGFTIAPNPANDVVYVFTKNNAVIKSIQVISIDGQVVKAINNYIPGQQINTSSLSKGVYVLKAVYKNNQVEFGRFIKM